MADSALYVYFLADDRHTRADGATLIKIGRSHTPEQRAKALQIGNGRRLRLLGWVPARDQTEKMLHEAFAHLRERGEWFAVTGDVVALIEAVCEEAERRELVGQLERSVALMRPTP